MSKTIRRRRMTDKNLKPYTGGDSGANTALRLAVWHDCFIIRKVKDGYGLVSGLSPKANTQILVRSKRNEVVAVRNEILQYFQHPMKRIRSDLDKWWSLKVRERDKHVCQLCTSLTSLQAHHWYINAQRSRMARWSIPNGITLCYGCHIHVAHSRPDYKLYKQFRKIVTRTHGRNITKEIEDWVQIETSDSLVRELWTNMIKPKD